MKIPRQKNLRSRAGRRPWLGLVLLALLLAGWSAAPAGAAAQDYESLRLLTEALHEISTKYVWPKSEQGMIDGALRGMVNSLDPDSSFLTPQEYKELQEGHQAPAAEAGLDLVVKDNLLTVVSVLDGGPAARAGLKPEDHLLKINGKLMRNLTTQEGMRHFQGSPGTTVKLQVLRNGLVKPLDLTITLEPVGPGKITTTVIQDAYLYLRVPSFSDDTPGQLATALKQAKRQLSPLKGLILDLRNNARGSLEQAVRTGGVLLGDKEIVATKDRRGEVQSYQGKAREQVLKPLPPLVVLVDQGTGRAAEIVAAALRDHGAGWLLGSKTFGLCGLTKVFPLKDGSALVMTVAQCYTPHGYKISGKGLEPEVTAKVPEATAAAAAQPVRPLNPQQDPWVLQAVKLLRTGKRGQVAKQE